MTQTPPITNWWALRRAALVRLGAAEVERRIDVARRRARAIADDPSWFADQGDREGVFVFMAWRLQALAVQLSDFNRFEASDHDTLGCVVVKMVTQGILT